MNRIRMLAAGDASTDELLKRFDGARAAFNRRNLDEADWPAYREQYELSLTGYTAGERARQRRRYGGAA